MAKQWTATDMRALAGGFQPACVVIGATELGVFDALADGPRLAAELAEQLKTDPRATTIMLDALVAIEVLAKDGQQYSLSPGVGDTLTDSGAQTVAAMVRHLGNCLRSWSQLARVVQSGRPAERQLSVRGGQADLTDFIEAMDNICRSVAGDLVEHIGPPKFHHLLDVGGGPGTWTVAFLQAAPDARATLYDRAEVLPIAQGRLTGAGLADRVELSAGDFYQDDQLPGGADLAWVSAIVHMNSRQQNRELFAKVHQALAEGGRIFIRDVVMADALTDPAAGAMFAVNMLVNTPGGRSYALGELCDDLTAGGFVRPELIHRDPFMNSVIRAKKS